MQSLMQGVRLLVQHVNSSLNDGKLSGDVVMGEKEAEIVRLREALNQIAFLSTNHGGWFENDPFGAYGELGDIARRALTQEDAA